MDSNSTRIDCRGEPSLEELLSDPIIQLVMRRDGLSVATVRGVFEDAARRLEVPEAGERQAA